MIAMVKSEVVEVGGPPPPRLPRAVVLMSPPDPPFVLLEVRFLRLLLLRRNRGKKGLDLA
ncbi:putative pectin methyltransferase QUA2 isoform X3 [Iris pallida]|uniref:Pectin methyltransferase QUA2 isoform X3 n=1 Tax=Iris pallida TaxID=29817 RepID=A0AAX6GHR3_IRIPA|nr:putative pectin methyltransferase QUA2 isoform X3 [Iris pallida]